MKEGESGSNEGNFLSYMQKDDITEEFSLALGKYLNFFLRLVLFEISRILAFSRYYVFFALVSCLFISKARGV